MRRFLQRLASLTASDEGRVVDEYRLRSPTATYQSAERVLGTAVERSGRGGERDALGGPLLQMVQLHAGATEPGAASARQADNEDVPQSLRAIAEPALAALLALMMQDVLPREHVHELYGSFEAVIPYTSLE